MRIKMNVPWLRRALIAAAALLASVPAARAQVNGAPNLSTGGGVTNQTTVGAGGGLGDSLAYGTVGTEHQREQFVAFQAFSKETDPAKRIQKGREFLLRYPKSSYAEQVDAGLMDIYRTQADWNNEYHYADQALALNPNDVDVLATVGWTIPHVINPNDSDADQELEKAEQFAKHAIDVLATLPKPPDLTEAQFTAAKAKRTYQAHSALGLVYFRRNDYDNSAKELELATKDNPTIDQTDLFVLGTDLQNLNRYSDAAEAFGRCAQVSGALQAQCKQGADATKAQAAVTKAK